jgi:hypothetical protein
MYQDSIDFQYDPRVGLTLVQALSDPLLCPCECHATLTLQQRTQGVRAMYRFDDAMRGWGYTPLYEPHAHALWREAQAKNDPSYRGVAVRDHACLYRRFVGFGVHELIHALCGDTSQANYGIPFGLPYGVPAELPAGAEKEYLRPFNESEARAYVGVPVLAPALYGIDWAVYTARDVGTYGFAGGSAVVPVPEGYRPIAHIDRQHNPERYYRLAEKLEDEARAWFTPERVVELVARVEAAEARGRELRKHALPPPEQLAAKPARKPGRNDQCPCGNPLKYKQCCGLNA